MTALNDAAQKGDTVVIRAFIAAGANVNFTEGGATPLHHAARRGHTDIAKALIAAGADPNAQNRYKRTPLHYAAMRSDVGLGKILVYSGARINSEDIDRNNPMDLAHKNGYNYLGYDSNDLAYEIVSSSDSRDKVVNKFKTEIAKAFLETVDHAKVSNKESKIPTDPATKKNPTEAVKVSVDTGGDTNATDADGRTALHVATKRGQTEIVKALIEAGANVDAKDAEGNTPLHIVAKKGQTGIAQALIEAGANPNAKDDDRNTPLHVAVKKGQIDVARVLLEAGANLNAKDDNGNTPLHIAVKTGKTDVVKALIDAGASVDTTDKNGLTPLDIAQTMENLNLIQILGAKLLIETKYIADSSRTHSDSTVIFTILFTALGYLAKVDGRVCPQEIEFVTNLMDEMKLAPERRRQAEDLFQLGKQKSGVDLDNLMIGLRNNCNANPEVLNVFVMSLIQLAYSDKDFSNREKSSIKKIAAQLNLNQIDIDSIEAAVRIQFQPTNSSLDLQEAYKVIGISPTTTTSNDEIKKVYRSLMKLYHPDTFKSKNLSEDMLQLFEKRTQGFTLAYERIRKVRSF